MIKKIVSVLLVLSIFVGIFPMTVTADGETVGESAENPILISEMEQLIIEMEKNVDSPTYYKLTEDVSHETSIEYFDGREDKTGDDGFDTIRTHSNSKLIMAQCVVGTGKKFLELDGYDIHYKNNVNFDNRSNSKRNGYKYDSLTFFYLGEGCDLTVTNSTGDDAQVWYDGWMHNRTNFFGGPNYTYTAVRDVFRVDTGAELTVSNTDIKAGRNRKIWMVHSFYLDKDKETNLLVKITYNGYAYEQIYGSAIVANGGKVIINGGYIEGRGGYRNQFNVSGVPEYDRDNIDCMFSDYTRESMIENCLSNRGAKAAVQIVGEGSKVIINDGEFWGCGGANVIGINGLNGGSVKEYTLRINAGTFDTSKTDKERVPDRNAGSPNSGPWPWSHSNWMLWANCRCIRDTLRGNIGIPAVDGYGEKVFNMKKVHVYIDDEENEVTYNANNDKAYYEDLNFRNKSDSDTIIVKPRAEKAYSLTDTHTQYNYAERHHYEIYAYSGGEIVADTLAGGDTLYYGPAETPAFYFSAESHYDLTDEDNPYFDRGHLAVCKWVLYEEDKNGNLITSYERVSAPFHTEHKDGHTVYNFKIPLSYFTRYSAVKWDGSHKYYMVAFMEERFGSIEHFYVTNSYTNGVFQDWENGVYDGDGILDYYYNYGLNIVYDDDYCGSFATSGAEVVYSNAVYDSDPVLTFNEAYKKLKGTKKYQWQVLENDEWQDYGNFRISPELAVEVLLMHRGLTGKQVRMKITSYDGIYKDALYSNVCTVQKDQNTRWPTIGVFNWYDDPENEGRYITKSAYYNDTQEWLIYPYDKDRDLSSLNWSQAKAEPAFDNLEVGVYMVYSRFKETVDFEAGTEIGYSKVVVGNYVEPTGTNILYNGKPVKEIFVKLNESFELTVGSVPDNATLNSTNVTRWIPDTGNIDTIIVDKNGVLEPFSDPVLGKTIKFAAAKLGYVTFDVLTKLDADSNSLESITVRVVPDNFVPYTVSVVNRGAEVIEGGSFVPQLSLHARIEMLTQRRATKFEAEDFLESDIKTQLQSDTIKKQLRERLTWALVEPIPQLGIPPYTTSTNKASINTNTGEITLKDAAVAGNVIRFVGILNDPYLGQIIIPGSFTVVAAPEPEPHTCNYEGYAVIEGNLNAHYRVCECGKKKTEIHSFKEFATESASQTVIKYVCSCGLSYSKTIDAPITIHVHALEYVYDNNNHWQICADEECPDAYFSTHQAHSFELLNDENGNEGYVCSVCKCFVTETLATISGKIKSFGSDTDDIIIELFAEGSEAANYTATVKGNAATYSMEGVAEGTYTLKVTKANHITQEYTIVVDEENIIQDAEIWLFGDVTGEGRVDSTDYLRIKGAFLGTFNLEGVSALAGDVTGEGRIDSTDYLRIKGHFLGTYNLHP